MVAEEMRTPLLIAIHNYKTNPPVCGIGKRKEGPVANIIQMLPYLFFSLIAVGTRLPTYTYSILRKKFFQNW